MTKTSKIILSILGVLIIAVGAGYFGSGLRGDGSGGSSTEAGAWLEKIKSNGELRVGIASAPPMTAEQPDGQMGGPNVLPLQQLADQLGVDFVPVSADWGNIVAGLQANRYDVAAYLDATTERSLSIQFTDPVYTYPGVFAVRADSGLKTTQDIIDAGTVSLAQGTSYEESVRSMGVDVQAADKIPNAVTAMKAGRADAAFADLPAMIGAASADPEIKLVVPDPVVYQVDSNYGVPEDIDDRSLQVLNIAIKNADNSGELSRAFTDAGILDVDDLGDLQMK